jgi:hypothetical protein
MPKPSYTESAKSSPRSKIESFASLSGMKSPFRKTVLFIDLPCCCHEMITTARYRVSESLQTTVLV